MKIIDNVVQISPNEVGDIIRKIGNKTTIVLVGEAGTGKTYMMDEIGKDFDIFIPKRMSGMTDEMIMGIPSPVKGKDGNDYFKFLTLDFIQQIQQNPDKKILLFIDELNRTPERLRPSLFSLLERNIADKVYPNLHIVTAINLGDAYEENWDIASDKALLSRVTMFSLMTNTESFFNHIEANDYNEILCNAARRVDHIVSHETTGEYEQTTNYRSWLKFNALIGQETNIEIVLKDLQRFGKAMFSNSVRIGLSNALERMIRQRKELNFFELIKAKKHSLEDTLFIKEYSSENIEHKKVVAVLPDVIDVLSKKPDILVQFCKKDTVKPHLGSILSKLSESTRDILVQIL